MRFLLMICIAAIFAIGVLMIFSTTSAEALELDLQHASHNAIIKQLLYAMGGVALATGVYNLGYRRFLDWSPLLLAVFVFFLILTLIPGIGREVNGSRRWLSLGGFSFQPSEFVKYIVPSYFIHRFLKEPQQAWTLLRFLKLIAIPIIPILLILVEPNNGTALVVAMTLVVLCLFIGVPLKYWAMPLCVLALVGGAFASQLPYVTGRINAYLHPELDLRGKGHQPYQAKIAVGSGGAFGRGPGNSLQKLSYLPEAQNDYIAAIFAEEFGFLGVVSLLSLYGMVACIGFYGAIHAVDRAGFYLAGTVVFLICFQASMNLGVVSGLLPSTGLNLPFFSQGGSSLLANLMGVGLLLSVRKQDSFLHP
ncbi:MAG: putative lipid II flippase FtsW [Parachlamydiaceae bacterium]|nr:putative lipid II flippase FtsW [Parachlamydiaceae bacterium]